MPAIGKLEKVGKAAEKIVGKGWKSVKELAHGGGKAAEGAVKVAGEGLNSGAKAVSTLMPKTFKGAAIAGGTVYIGSEMLNGKSGKEAVADLGKDTVDVAKEVGSHALFGGGSSNGGGGGQGGNASQGEGQVGQDGGQEGSFLDNLTNAITGGGQGGGLLGGLGNMVSSLFNSKGLGTLGLIAAGYMLFCGKGFMSKIAGLLIGMFALGMLNLRNTPQAVQTMAPSAGRANDKGQPAGTGYMLPQVDPEENEVQTVIHRSR